jgi:polysaccharide deacetylase 2 family uncharacterized protein YibQ
MELKNVARAVSGAIRCVATMNHAGSAFTGRDSFLLVTLIHFEARY